MGRWARQTLPPIAAVPWPGWCAEPSRGTVQSLIQPVFVQLHAWSTSWHWCTVKDSTGSWCHQPRVRNVMARNSWKWEMAKKSGDWDRLGLCVRHDPWLLIFSFNCTYFYSSSVKRQIIFPKMSNGQWYFLGTENGFLGKLLQVAFQRGLWSKWKCVGKARANSHHSALQYFLPEIPFLFTSAFLCGLVQAILYVQECYNSIASSGTWLVHLSFLDESKKPHEKQRKVLSLKECLRERALQHLFFPPVYIFKYTTLFNHYYYSDYCFIFSDILAVLNQIFFFFIFFNF